MRNIHVNGIRYRYSIGTSYAKIVNTKTGKHRTVLKGTIGTTVYDCELHCNPTPHDKSTMCTHGRMSIYITPADIRKYILAENF